MSNTKNPIEAQKAQENAVVKTSFVEKNKKALIAGVVVVLGVVAGVIVYNTYVAKPRQLEASTAMAKAQDLFGMENYEAALNGDSTGVAGFAQIASDYSGTDAANLANLYAGLCCANLEKWQEAVDYLEKYDGCGDQMISPAATAALGNAYAHVDQTDKAIELLKKAAKQADNNSLSPTFLIQAGEMLESQGKKAEALKLYEEVKSKYVNSMQYQTIDKYIERASAN